MPFQDVEVPSPGNVFFWALTAQHTLWARLGESSQLRCYACMQIGACSAECQHLSGNPLHVQYSELKYIVSAHRVCVLWNSSFVAHSSARFLPENYSRWGHWVYPWLNDGGSWAPCRRAHCLTRWSSSSLKFSIVSPQSVYRGKGHYLFDCAIQRSKVISITSKWSAATYKCSQYRNYRMGCAFDDAHVLCYKLYYWKATTTLLVRNYSW